MAKSVIVIGAGIGGLSAAIRLANRGFDVTLLEKNPQVGGKLYEYSVGGFRWDTGPTMITMKPVLEALFRDVGRDMASYLRLLPVDPQTRYVFPDGAIFNAWRDWPSMAAEISQLGADDLQGYLRYLTYAAQLYRSAGPIVGDTSVSTAGNAAALPDSDWTLVDRLSSMDGAIKSHVKSDKLQRILARFASAIGGSPFQVPATLNFLAHIGLTGGSWYPQNGIFSLVEALEKLALELGVAIKVNCLAVGIEIKRGKAIGVRLAADDQLLPADAVVSNVDSVATARFLLPQQALPSATLRRLNRTEMSASAFVIMLGIRGSFPQLAHHNVFFSEDAKRENYQIFKRETMPDDPTISLTISSKTDRLHAPVDQENWLIQVNAPALSEKFDWASQQAPYRDRILQILNQRFGLNLRDRIRVEKHLTPADLQRISGAWRGALHGPSLNRRFAAFGPSPHRSARIERLYYAGGTVYPGGIPFAMLSGKLSTAMITEDLG